VPSILSAWIFNNENGWDQEGESEKIEGKRDDSKLLKEES